MEKNKKVRVKSSVNPILIVLVVVIVVIFSAVLVQKGILRNIFERVNQTTETTEKEKESSSGGEEGEITIKEEDGLPKNFPQDFPIYPNAKIESSFTSEGEDVEASSVIWLTNDSFEQVSNYYQRQLPASGWQIDSTFEDENSVTFSIIKDSLVIFIGIGESKEGPVVISVTVGTSFEEPSI